MWLIVSLNCQTLLACWPTLLLCVEPAAGASPQGVSESVKVKTGKAFPGPVQTPANPSFWGQPWFAESRCQNWFSRVKLNVKWFNVEAEKIQSSFNRAHRDR